jgi:GT2 family glycosyltransferase
MSIEVDARQLRALYAAHARPARARVSSRPAAARLAAVVLNYRTPDETLLTVQSLQRSERRPDDMIVVDNGSEDGSEERIRGSGRDAHVVQSGANLGFSGGINVGIREALARGAERVLLVNSDVIVPPSAIRTLEEALAARPDAGVAGPVILSRAEPGLVASAGMTFAPTTGRMRHVAFGRPFASLDASGAAVVDAVSGCVMLVGREVFERVGLFAEEFFFSFEDLDFCLRARRAGFATICVASAAVYHAGGASIGVRSARRVYFGTRNQLLAASRHDGVSGLPAAARAALIIGLNAAHVLRSRQVPLVPGLGAVARGAADHWRGRWGSGG